jgi:hypothetical protein
VYLPIWKAGKQEEIWNTFEQVLFSDMQKNDHVAQYHLFVEEE